MKPTITKVSKIIDITFFSPLQEVVSLLLGKIKVRRNDIALKKSDKKVG